MVEIIVVYTIIMNLKFGYHLLKCAKIYDIYLVAFLSIFNHPEVNEIYELVENTHCNDGYHCCPCSFYDVILMEKSCL